MSDSGRYIGQGDDELRREIAEGIASGKIPLGKIREEGLSFKWGRYDKVRRCNGGYTFNGIVLVGYKTLLGKVMYVVEHETEKGMQHIFSEDSLESRE
jgi:hypothetical protein